MLSLLTRPRPAPPPGEVPRASRGRRVARRAHTTIGVAFLALLLAALGIVLIVPSPPTGPAHPAPGQVIPGQASPGKVTPDTAGSVCGLPAGDQTVPTGTPDPTTWTTVGTMTAPSAPTVFGPGKSGAGVPYCYADDPLGALYAGVNFVAAATAPNLRVAAAKYLTAAGPGRDKLIDTSERGGVGGPGTSDLQLGGFQVTNYDQGSATVDLAFRYGTRYVHLPVPLRWEVGDWKVVVPDNGLPFAAFQVIPNVTQYVPWSGR